MPNKKLVKTKTSKEIMEDMGKSTTGFDAWYVLQEADKETKNFKGSKEIEADSNYYKAMTLMEFDKGVLLMNSVPKLHRVFALEFSKNIQKEYKCETPSEKSMAETISLNFVRILEAQRKINSYLEMGTINQNGIGYLNVMSKELDRAQRHYLSSLQALRMLKAPPLEVNIKTQNAFMGNNQVLQKNEIN